MESQGGVRPGRKAEGQKPSERPLCEGAGPHLEDMAREVAASVRRWNGAAGGYGMWTSTQRAERQHHCCDVMQGAGD